MSGRWGLPIKDSSIIWHRVSTSFSTPWCVCVFVCARVCVCPRAHTRVTQRVSHNSNIWMKCTYQWWWWQWERSRRRRRTSTVSPLCKALIGSRSSSAAQNRCPLYCIFWEWPSPLRAVHSFWTSRTHSLERQTRQLRLAGMWRCRQSTITYERFASSLSAWRRGLGTGGMCAVLPKGE